MQALVYFFSKFTSEALFFEAIIILVLSVVYFAYYVLRRRDVDDEELVPASLVKEILKRVLGEAHSAEHELFGVLTPRPEFSGAHSGPSAESGSGSADHEEVQALRVEVQEKTKSVGTLNAKISELEKRLAEGVGAAGGGGAVDTAELDAIRAKLKSAEDRLAEYSVIEDDLANLKRLQQENAKLKAQLGGGAPAATESQSPEPPAPEPSGASLDEPPAASEAALDDTAGESLGDLLAESSGASAGADESSLAAGSEASPAPVETKAEEPPKGDDDLLAEFEKMLQS